MYTCVVYIIKWLWVDARIVAVRIFIIMCYIMSGLCQEYYHISPKSLYQELEK